MTTSSPDRPGDVYRPYQSVNFVTAHDGFSLYDLVAYDRKHNEQNGQGNRDGADHSLSWNCGWEGDDGVPGAVLELRQRQVKNFCALLMLSNGTPMFCAGDEFCNTQGGNNNPYNQDNETTWLDWSRLEQFKERARVLPPHGCPAEIAAHAGTRSLSATRDVHWYGAHGEPDLGSDSRTLAYRLSGATFDEEDLYVMINASHLPGPLSRTRRHRRRLAPHRRHRPPPAPKTSPKSAKARRSPAWTTTWGRDRSWF